MGNYDELHAKEIKDATEKEKQLQVLSYINGAKLGYTAASTIVSAISARKYKKASEKIDDTVKSIEEDINNERSKENPDKKKLAIYLKQIKKLKRSKFLLKALVVSSAVNATSSAINTGKSINTQRKITDRKKTANVEKRVAVTYDKNGVKEEKAIDDILKSYRFIY